jgi:hypothetical protein
MESGAFVYLFWYLSQFLNPLSSFQNSYKLNVIIQTTNELLQLLWCVASGIVVVLLCEIKHPITVVLVVTLEELPVPLQQGDNDASSLLVQALVVYLKLTWRLAWFWIMI